jgi:hypothetical protein
LKPENTTLRVALKIAEREDGTFRVAADIPDQGYFGHINVEATSVTYHPPTVKMEFSGIGTMFEGTVDDTDRIITGNLSLGGKPTPLTVERARPEIALASDDPAIEVQKDYSHAGPNDLPGHWQGTLDAKQAGVKFRLAVNIAKLPDGTFSCSMINLDREGTEIPASTIQYVPPNVHLEWNAIDTSYNGKLENGKLTGAWRQGGGAVPLVLERNATE